MTFREFLKRQRKRQDRIGDFARDALADEDAPKRGGNRERWSHYLINHIGCVPPKVKDAFQAAWAEYEATGREVGWRR